MTIPQHALSSMRDPLQRHRALSPSERDALRVRFEPLRKRAYLFTLCGLLMALISSPLPLHWGWVDASPSPITWALGVLACVGLHLAGIWLFRQTNASVTRMQLLSETELARLADLIDGDDFLRRCTRGWMEQSGAELSRAELFLVEDYHARAMGWARADARRHLREVLHARASEDLA